MLPFVFAMFTVFNAALPFIISQIIQRTFRPTIQQYQLIKSFSLLLLGMFLSSLATLNFSLALLVGLLATPLTYIQPLPGKPLLVGLYGIVLHFIAPTAVLYASA